MFLWRIALKEGDAVSDASTPCRSPMARALHAASRFEPDPVKLMQWFNEDALEGFGDLTARALCKSGRLADMLAFLDAVSLREEGGVSDHAEHSEPECGRTP